MPKASLIDTNKNVNVPDTLPAKIGAEDAFLALPDSPTEQLPDIVTPAWSRCPALVFAYRQSETFWNKLNESVRGLAEGDPCLTFPDPLPPVKLSPLRFSLVAAQQYWALHDNRNDHKEVSYTRQTGKVERLQWSEFIESVIIVYLADRVVPAAARWKSTKCPVCQLAATTLKKAADPAWASLSNDHALSMRIPKVWARFSVSVSVKPRTGQDSGNIYHVTEGKITPASAADVMLLQQGFAQEQTKKWYHAAVEQYQERVESLKKLVKS